MRRIEYPAKFVRAKLFALAIIGEPAGRLDCRSRFLEDAMMRCRPRDRLAVYVAPLGASGDCLKTLQDLALKPDSFFASMPVSWQADLRTLMRQVDSNVPMFVARKFVARSALTMHCAERRGWLRDVDENSTVYLDVVRDELLGSGIWRDLLFTGPNTVVRVGNCTPTGAIGRSYDALSSVDPSYKERSVYGRKR